MEIFLKPMTTSTWKHLTRPISNLKNYIQKEWRFVLIWGTMTYRDMLAKEYFMRYELSEKSRQSLKSLPWYGRVFGWFLGAHLQRRLRKESDLSVELQAHVALKYQQYVSWGTSVSKALEQVPILSYSKMQSCSRTCEPI